MNPRRGRVDGPCAGRGPAVVAALAIAAGVLTLLAGCGGTGPESASPTVGTAPAAATGGGSIPDADRAAIRATVDAVNAAARGPVADQQVVLLDRTDPDRRAEVQRCPAATSTVRFEPVDRGLRAAPGSPKAPDGVGDQDRSGEKAEPAGTGTSNPEAGSDGRAYQWPTLIRIYAGDRVVGTDLTTLQITVRSDGPGVEAYLTPFCVN